MESPLRVLMVDDSGNDRFLIVHELEREFPGLRTVEITDPESLREALKTGRFDLVITDCEICWTNGIEVLNAVKRLWPDCPVIMVTGTGSEEIAVTAMKSGLDDYVLKSIKHLHSLPTVVRMVQERCRQKMALREMETRYHRLYDQVPIGLFRADMAGHFVDVNLALVRMLQYPDHTALLAALDETVYLDLDDRDEWSCRAEQGGMIQGFELSLKCREGKPVWTSLSASVTRDASGQVRGYEGSIEDITHRKQIEAALFESEQRYRTIAEMVSDFTYSCLRQVDGAIHMDWIAGAFTRITGFSLADVEQHGGWQNFIIDEDREIVYHQIDNARQGQVNPAEFRIRHRKGDIRWLRNHVRPVTPVGGGDPRHFWGAAQDITAQKA